MAFLKLRDPDRVRILTAVATRGAAYQLRRVVVITLSQILLLAVPILGIARVDLWDGRHVLLGESVGFTVALRGVVIAIAALWGTTFATNILVGRFFCGWGCPVGYVSRLGEDVDLRRRRGRDAKWLFSHAAGAAFVAVFVGAMMSWWVDPAVMLEGSGQARLVTGATFAVLSVGGFLHAFRWRFGFCKSACPIGLYYRFVTSRTPIGIVFSNEPSPCIECGACEKICPVDLDPKALGQPLPAGAVDQPEGGDLYGDAECIRCGDCIEACRMIFKGRKGETPPLRFGRVGGGRVSGVTPGVGRSHPSA